MNEAKWVKVEDRLPDVGLPVWVFYSNTTTGAYAQLMSKEDREEAKNAWPEFNFDSGNWWDGDFFHPINDVTHWMPIPEPPQK